MFWVLAYGLVICIFLWNRFSAYQDICFFYLFASAILQYRKCLRMAPLSIWWTWPSYHKRLHFNKAKRLGRLVLFKTSSFVILTSHDTRAPHGIFFEECFFCIWKGPYCMDIKKKKRLKIQILKKLFFLPVSWLVPLFFLAKSWHLLH